MMEIKQPLWDHRTNGGTRNVPIHGNPLRPQEVTGKIKIAIDDPENDAPPTTLPDGTPLLTQAGLAGKRFDDAGSPKKGMVDN